MSEKKAARRAAFFWLLAAVCTVGYVLANEAVRWAVLRLQPLGIAFVYAAMCCGFGAWTLRVAQWCCNDRVRPQGLHTDPLLAFGLGAGVLGAIVFVAGLLHSLSPLFFVLLLSAGVTSFGIALFWWKVEPGATQSGSGVGWVVLAGTILLILPFVIAPELSTDALEYHLLIPKLDLLQNSLARIPSVVESNYPSLGEYHFIALLASGNDIAPKCFHFLCALAVLWTLRRISLRVSPQADGVLAAALFFMMPLAALTSGWAWNDMLFTLFVLLSLVQVMEGRFTLAGLFFGLATWTKYTFVLAAIGMSVVLLRGWRSRWWKGRDVLRFAVFAGAVAGIWMTKNAVDTGSPVYPFLNSVFHSPLWNDASARHFHDTLTHYEIPQWRWWTYLAFPFLLTVTPRVIDVHAGILPLILLPLAFLKRLPESESSEITPGSPAVAILRTYALGIVAGWLLIGTEARSLLTLFAILAVLYATVIDVVPAWRALVVLGFALNAVILLVSTQVITDPYRYLLGRESKAAYIERMDPKQRVYYWLDRQPEVSSVLLVGLHDPYYLRKRAQFSSCCDQPIVETLVRRYGSAESIAAALRRDGVSHVAVRTSAYSRENVEGLYSWTAAQREVFRNFLATACSPVVRFGDIGVFAIR